MTTPASAVPPASPVPSASAAPSASAVPPASAVPSADAVRSGHPPEPLSPDAPLPPRKIIRSWLIPLSERSTPRALLLFALDATLFIAALAALVVAPHWLVKLALGVLAGVLIARLFILGHDACHQSLTPRRGLNKWLGRIAFLPSLTPYSLWEVGHNVVHHGYTNLKGFDFVWAPYSMEEYAALPRWRRALERLYRNGLGAGLYYLIEIWWLKLFFPSRRQMATRRPIFLADCLLAAGFAALWIGALAGLALATNQSVALLLLAGFAVPFLVWNATVGFVLYVHHTHESVAWYDSKAMWARAQPFVSTTVHLRFRHGVGALLHPHHGTHRPPRRHERAAVPAQARAGAAGAGVARPHRGAELLVALVFRYRAPLQAVRLPGAVLDRFPRPPHHHAVAGAGVMGSTWVRLELDLGSIWARLGRSLDSVRCAAG